MYLIPNNNSNNVSVGPKKWRAVSSYDADRAFGQINLASGEVVEEMRVEDNWTVVRNTKGRLGGVPSDLLGQIETVDNCDSRVQSDISNAGLDWPCMAY